MALGAGRVERDGARGYGNRRHSRQFRIIRNWLQRLVLSVFAPLVRFDTIDESMFPQRVTASAVTNRRDEMVDELVAACERAQRQVAEIMASFSRCR